eukprot:GGOE01061185.1.p1 GENE.GGOE01061185.1~~GGOE01061185.1.p1  ORF type:complete len:206 (+),score=62.42 GGOE01061185.1:53-619(+)
MSAGTAFALSGIVAGVCAAEALAADCLAQTWEVKGPRRQRRRGNDCSFMDCGRTVRFLLVPGLLQGLTDGFVQGWFWGNYYDTNFQWPSTQDYAVCCVITDSIAALVFHPLAYILHGRPLKRNFLLGTGLATLYMALCQLICGFIRSRMWLCQISWELPSFLLLSSIMYRGAYPELVPDLPAFEAKAL